MGSAGVWGHPLWGDEEGLLSRDLEDLGRDSLSCCIAHFKLSLLASFLFLKM